MGINLACGMGLKLLNKIKVSIRALSGTKALQSDIFYHLRKLFYCVQTLLIEANLNIIK